MVRALLSTCVLFILVLPVACASPAPELWPPAPGTPGHPIYISLDTWHGMIAFPLADDREANRPLARERQDSTSSEGDDGGYEEWGYAERGWYMEGRTGVTGVLRALLWPTEGVVEVGRHARVWAERTPQPPAELFVFHLSGEGYARLRRHLQETIADPSPIAQAGTSRFYPAKASYHLFHTCHQFAAQALREAGLPLSPGFAVTRSLLALQLRRAQRVETGASRSSDPSGSNGRVGH
ncbi:DUF2459 domain-containing protein [Candidatus Nitrospira bockiana]